MASGLLLGVVVLLLVLWVADFVWHETEMDRLEIAALHARDERVAE